MSKKYPNWRINVQSQAYYTVEIEAESEKQACDRAVREIQRNPNYYNTGGTTLITGVMINDRHAREFHAYVPEGMPENAITQFPEVSDSD